MRFRSILFPSPAGETPPPETVDFIRDLNLDQIVGAVTAGYDHLDLKPFFYQRLSDPAEIAYRQEVMRDLEVPETMERTRIFLSEMRAVKETLAHAGKMHEKRQKDRVFVDAVALYVDVVEKFSRALAGLPLCSQGLGAFAAYLAAYGFSPILGELRAESEKVRKDLAAVRYCVAIQGSRVSVRGYADEADYSAAVGKTFERFRQDAAKDYRLGFREGAEMNHVEAQILELVARLNPETFGFLERFAAEHQDFLDPVIDRFFREIHFYVLYLDHIAPMRATGLPFCHAEILVGDRQVMARDTFDLALAGKLVSHGTQIVTNDFALENKERIFVVSGPNQGGKTTFLRTFGQLHHLAGIGCPVPGRAARLLLHDRIFTHFERAESVVNLRGKLQDDLIRIHDILARMTPASIVLMNEIFASTTLDDAVFLASEVMRRIIAMDCLAVCVTFLDELAALDPKVVSMTSTVQPDDPALRTLKIIRRPADGRAYAITIAEKYRLSREWLHRRLAP